MSMPSNVKIVEVGTVQLMRGPDAYSDVSGFLEFVGRLIRAGTKHIAIAQSGDGRDCMAAHLRRAIGTGPPSDACPVTLIDEYEHLGSAVDAFKRHVSILTVDVAVSDGFAKNTYGCSAAQQLRESLEQISSAGIAKIAVRARIVGAYGCPYQGCVAGGDVAILAATLYNGGCREIVLADMLGVATPHEARSLVEEVAKRIPVQHIGVRFHDTYGLALTNIYSCLAAGIGSVESSIGGIYGETNGNYPATPVATEDVVNMLCGMNIETGVDLGALDAGGCRI